MPDAASAPGLPLVSVVLPTRDRPRLLSIALECYSRQTYQNRELIVVDDGDSAPVDAAAVEAVGGRVLRVPPGLALGSKLNVGIEQARGTFIQKMDDDDFYASTFMATMVGAVFDQWQQVSRPSMAILVGFLFFDVARWEVRRSLPQNAPGATLFFGRELWEEQPFRGVPRDEDVWFYQDRMRLGDICVTVNAPETFLAVRHRGSPGDRGHTWIRQLDGQTLETYLLDRPLHPAGPEGLLSDWALPRYQDLRREILAGTADDSRRVVVPKPAPASASASGPLPSSGLAGRPRGAAAAGTADGSAIGGAADVLLRALTAPAALSPDTVHRLLHAVRRPAVPASSTGAPSEPAASVAPVMLPADGTPHAASPLADATLPVPAPSHDPDAALTALAAALYARSELAADALVDLWAVLDGPPLAPTTERRLGEVLRGAVALLAATPAAGSAEAAAQTIATLGELLLDRLARPDAGANGPRAGALLATAEQVLAWDPAAFDADRVVRLVAAHHLAPFRARLLVGLLEPVLLARPAAVTVAHLDLLAGRYAYDPDFGPLLAYLSDAAEAAPDVRAVAHAGLASRLPLRAEVVARLAAPVARVLAVHTGAATSADEIVQVAPLLQALLASSPDLQVTLITDRPHLYGNLRLTVVSLDDPDGVNAAFAEPTTALVNVCDDARVDASAAVADLRRRVQAYREQQRPFLFIAAGARQGRLTIESLEVQGRPYAASLGLDRARVASPYEVSYRLAAHLGLPVRLGQDAADPQGANAVLAALPSQTAADAWADVLRGNVEGRPVALVAPFGDAAPLHGVAPASYGDLTRRIAALVAEGFFVVLLPTDQPPGDASGQNGPGQLLDLLDPADRAHVAVAPDAPDATGDAQRVACEGLGDILVSRAACRQRLLLAWVQYADLVVGAAGWLLHAAALHGKPYRVFPAPHGGDAAPAPYGRSPEQVLLPAPPPVSTPLASLLDRPPLPVGAHRDLLLFVLRSLSGLPSAVAHDDASPVSVVRWALSSADREVRLAAAETLIRARALRQAWAVTADDMVLSCLADRWCRVRAVAADALLTEDVTALTGNAAPSDASQAGRRGRRTLRAHRLIGQPVRDWDAILALGEDADPAVQAALSDDDPAVRHEATRALARQFARPEPSPAARATTTAIRPDGVSA